MESSGHILIIDDEASVRSTLRRVLQKAGFQVSSATNGSEALEKIAVERYHLVYLDIRMPGMSGLDVLQEIRKIKPELSVILLTAHASLQTALDAIRLGARDYLVKPIDPEVFVSQTRIILEEELKQHRSQEIRDQIAELRSELRALEKETDFGEDQPPAREMPLDGERFLKKGRFILDLQALRATLGERVINLPPTGFAYLQVLVLHSPDAVDYKTLVLEAQGYEVDQSEASELAKYHIHVLRQIIEVDSEEPGQIINVRGVGYRLMTD
jgi:DNA-binding response OmpR family regulator